MRVKVRMEKEKGVTELSSYVCVCVAVYFSLAYSVFQLMIVVGLTIVGECSLPSGVVECDILFKQSL